MTDDVITHALLQIDKLSLERVSVFPDGDINIEAVATAHGSAAFSKPVSSGMVWFGQLRIVLMPLNL